jgi:hypothetical protein
MQLGAVKFRVFFGGFVLALASFAEPLHAKEDLNLHIPPTLNFSTRPSQPPG